MLLLSALARRMNSERPACVPPLSALGAGTPVVATAVLAAMVAAAVAVAVALGIPVTVYLTGGIFWVPHRRGFPGGFLKKVCASPCRAQGASQPGADVPTVLLSLGHVCVHVCVHLKCALRSHLWLKLLRCSLHGCRSTAAVQQTRP